MRNQFRTVIASCFPRPGVLPSQIMSRIRRQLDEFQKTLPTGYKMEIGGEEEEQDKGFADMAVAMVISVVAIFIALVIRQRCRSSALRIWMSAFDNATRHSGDTGRNDTRIVHCPHNGLSPDIGETYSSQLLIFSFSIGVREMASTKRLAICMFVISGMLWSTAILRIL